MREKFFLSVLCVTLVAVCTLIFSGQPRGNNLHALEAHPAQPSADELPEHVPYLFLFNHLKHLKQRAEQQQRRGKDGSGFQRRFREALALDDNEFARLNEIALSCEAELTVLDRKADVIIKQFKKQYPDGVVPEGVIIPPPPAELLALQEERNQTILRARDRVRESLGEQHFSRFDVTMKSRLLPNIKRVSPANPEP